MELLVTMTVMALVFAMIVPNLGAFIPEAKLDGSGKQIVRTLDWVRSEARIQAKRMAIDLDLDHARWRIVYPPEQKLTRDQDVSTLEERPEDWTPLEKGVVFAGAGDSKNGLAHKNLYRISFDEHGFTADQLVVLKLEADSTLVWSLVLNGLSGNMTIEKNEQGHEAKIDMPSEGAF